MPERNAHQAVSAFVEPLQGVASCLTHEQFVLSPGAYSGVGIHAVRLGTADFVGLRSGREIYNFMAQIEFDVVENPAAERAAERMRVRTRGYRYHLLTEDFVEIVMWHWHPTGRSRVTAPHMHIGKSQIVATGVSHVLQQVPSGRVSFEEVAIHLVTEVRVATLRPRDDALNVMFESAQNFYRHRSWSSLPPPF